MKKITLLLALLMVSVGFGQSVLEDFEGTAPTVTGTSTLEASISSDVAKDLKSLKIITEASGDAWQSANLILQGDIIDLRTTKTVTADVHATTAFKMLCKVVGGAPESATSASHTGSGWETLTFDFSNPEDGTSEANDAYGEIQFFTNWDGTGSGTNTTNANWNNSIAGTFYVDNISGVGFTPLVDTPPTVAPAVPAELAVDVISVYSDSYATIATNINPNWGQATVVSEIDFAGNKVMKYANLNYQGLEYTSTDVSAKEYLHLDYYTTDATAFQLFLVAGNEQFYDVAATDVITTGQWVSLDIPLSFFADKGSDLTVATQFKTVGNNNLYLDNLYFHGAATAAPVDTPPTVAPAVPAELAADVISVYSDSYATIATNLNPNWGQATVVSEIDFAGNKVMKYANLNYQGLEYTSTDVSAKGYLHLDYYTTDATAFQLFLVAGNEQFYDVAATDVITAGQWVSLDIPLSFFADKGSDLTVATQFKTVGNNNLYLDNLYFHGAATPVDPALECEGQTAEYAYTFETLANGTDVKVTIELLNTVDGLVAQYFNDGSGNQNPTLVSGQKYEYTFTGLTDGTEIAFTAGFAWAAGGGLQVSRSYTVGNDCATASNIDNNMLKISLYPSPAQNELTISAENTIQNVSIYNVLGRKVQAFNVNAASKKLDVSALSTGIYILKYTANNAVGSMKFVKE